MEPYILALDQGTTSSRALIFNQAGMIAASVQIEFRQHFPQPGWVEHDPFDILESQLKAAKTALANAGLTAKEIAAIGITNQRETTLIWEKESGKPVYNAIVWQCRRTTEICAALKAGGLENTIQERTGLVLDPYFSATKISWLLDNIAGLRTKAEQGQVLFGTVDTWLVYHLTGRHVTDYSNASRTMLFNIHTGRWDEELLRELHIPAAILPEVVCSSCMIGSTKPEIFGAPIPVAGIAGDQQAALFGQGCHHPGEVKNTYGTGCFALMNTGAMAVHSSHNLLTTIAWNLGKGVVYALEGAVFVAGAAIQWLRDQLQIITSAAESEAIAMSVENTDGVYFVPAFTGLGAPYWQADVRGVVSNLTRGTTKAHLVRAALESIAFQVYDLFYAMKMDMGSAITGLKVDGGATQNNFLMQFQADLLNIPIQRAGIQETTAFGAACLAGLGIGFWNDPGAIPCNQQTETTFKPGMNEQRRTELLSGWKAAVAMACHKKNMKI